MQLWFINHYAGLPATVPATRPFDLGKHLVRLGHSVTIFACSFNHYTFAEEQLSFFQLIKIEEIEGVRFVWIKGPSYRGNDWRRLLNMLTFAILTFIVGVRLSPKPDLIIGTTVHPFAPISAFLLSRLRRARFWMDITDVWPQSLIDLGHISAGGFSARLCAQLMRFSLNRAEVVTSVLPNIADYVRDSGLVNKRTIWTPNGIDEGRLATFVETAKNDNSCFTAMFAGGFARQHALDVILDAAALIQANGKTSVRFVLIGDGLEAGFVKSRIEVLGLSNVVLRGFVPKQELYDHLAQADVLLCTGRYQSVHRYGISWNKISDYLLVGRPIIFALSSSNDPVAEAKAGLSVPAENPKALADAIVELSNTPPHIRQEMGQRGREFALSELNYANIARRVEKLF